MFKDQKLKKKSQMLRSENKLLVEKAALIWKTKNFNSLYEIYDENCIHHQQSSHHDIKFIGIEKWRQCMEEFLVKYPDYEEKIVDQVAEDDKVVSVLECQGGNITWSGITIDLIRNHKIVETWVWFKRLSPI
jgi:predicted ester cyclase